MRLSTKGQYAVRAMVDLAIHSKGAPITITEIAGREDISINYLEQLFSKLRRGGIVKSVKGPGGGYLLGKEPENITMADIINVVEEDMSPVACVDSKKKKKCPKTKVCVTRKLWGDLGKEIKGFLSGITLGDMCKRAMKLKEYNSNL